MFEKLKDIFYDISDYVVTIIIVFFIVISIGFIMTKSYGLEFSKNDLLSFFQKGKNTEVLSTKTPSEVQGNVPKTSTEIPKTTADPKTETPLTTTGTTSTTGTTTDPDKTAEDDKKEEDKDQPVPVEIYEGDGAYDIAGRLVDSGVIKDADEFVNELIARGLDTSVRIGQYNFKKDMTMDEVFKVLFD